MTDNDRMTWDKIYRERMADEQLCRRSMQSSYSNGAYIRKILKYAGTPALELGSGTGGNSLILNKLRKTSNILVDYSKEAINLSKELFSIQGGKADFVVADMRRLPFKNNSFKLIHSESSIEHVNNYHEVISEISRCLISGGYVIVSVPNKLRLDGYRLWVKIKKRPYLTLSFTPFFLKNLMNSYNLKTLELFGLGLVGPLVGEFLNFLLRRLQRIFSRHLDSSQPGVSHTFNAFTLSVSRILKKTYPPMVTAMIGVIAKKSINKAEAKRTTVTILRTYTRS